MNITDISKNKLTSFESRLIEEASKIFILRKIHESK